MLEPPNLAAEILIGCLRAEFDVSIARLEFLPLGADLGTAVYRAEGVDGRAYFVKLRRGAFDANTVRVPALLAARGIAEIIASRATRDGALWAPLDVWRVMVYPFVDGQNGFAVKLSASQWQTFGAALAKIHATRIPPPFSIARETFTPRWREMVAAYLKNADTHAFDDPLANELATFMRSKRVEILALLARTHALAETVQARAFEFVLCHGDIHSGNLLLTHAGALHIVDWDTLILAPRERDLMFIGGAQGFAGYTPQQECELFYRGYGAMRLDHNALMYYRGERIIQDLAVECEQIFSMVGSADDRAQALEWFQSNFLPGGTLELAYSAER